MQSISPSSPINHSTLTLTVTQPQFMLHVDLSSNAISNEHSNRTYPIYIGSGIRLNPELIAKHLRKNCQQLCVITNTTVGALYLAPVLLMLQQTFPDKQIECLQLPDGEAHKNIEQLEHILTHLLKHHFDRNCMLIALGGGVIGDITGFAASIYLRGVDFIQMPTTLLAQVDSSIGGKTAINHPLGKNMIGAFWQPKAVISDLLTLNSLDARTFNSGLAEMIKHGFIADESYVAFLETHMQDLAMTPTGTINSNTIEAAAIDDAMNVMNAVNAMNDLQPAAFDVAKLGQAVYDACAIKAKIVKQDETEQNVRAYLNFGHTFAHAIESAAGYGTYLHGEAVAIGMCLAARWHVNAVNHLSIYARLSQLLKAAHLPTMAVHAQLTAENYIHYMQGDKKNAGGCIRLILLNEIAAPCLQSVETKALYDFLSDAITSST